MRMTYFHTWIQNNEDELLFWKAVLNINILICTSLIEYLLFGEAFVEKVITDDKCFYYRKSWFLSINCQIQIPDTITIDVVGSY